MRHIRRYPGHSSYVLPVARDRSWKEIPNRSALFLLTPFFYQLTQLPIVTTMDSKAEGQRQTMLEKARRKIYEESERERQKIAKVTHCNKIVLDGST